MEMMPIKFSMLEIILLLMVLILKDRDTNNDRDRPARSWTFFNHAISICLGLSKLESSNSDRPRIPDKDIAQGEAGDCWFLSSLCSWATYVDAHDKMMLDKVICRTYLF